jgi:ABC-type proline/glycine betaine transport system substrate-binding protein
MMAYLTTPLLLVMQATAASYATHQADAFVQFSTPTFQEVVRDTKKKSPVSSSGGTLKVGTANHF